MSGIVVNCRKLSKKIEDPRIMSKILEEHSFFFSFQWYLNVWGAQFSWFVLIFFPGANRQRIGSGENCRKMSIDRSGGWYMGKKYFLHREVKMGGPDPVEIDFSFQITELLDRARRSHLRIDRSRLFSSSGKLLQQLPLILVEGASG